MAELSDRDIDQIHVTHDTVVQLKTILVGVNGNPGLCKQVDDLSSGHSSLKKSFWTLVGILVGGGALGGGVAGVLKLLG